MSIVKYVRGNTMLLTVTLTEKHQEGDPTVVDVEAYDSWAANVYRCGSVAKSKAGGVITGVDTEKRVTLLLPPTLSCGVYSVEIVLTKEDIGRRSFEIPVFEVVETNGEADITYELIDGMRSADIDMQFQFVEVDAILGENAYEMWKKLPGNEDKTLQDFIDEVLDLNGITARATTAAERAETAAYNAEHLPYIGSNNFVYEWDAEEGRYVQTNVYVKGDPGQDADMSQLYTKSESDARYQQKEAGKGLSSNDYTTAEKQKLAGLENYDDSNIRWLIQNVQASLANYYTKSETYSRSQVDALVASIPGMEIVSVNILPSASVRTMGKIYLVPTTSTTVSNVKDEYITIHEGSTYQWEKIGSTSVDLTGYLKDTDVADVALSGSYNDLKDKPTIPAEVTESTVAGWGFTKNTGTYSKPSGGIPSSDLSSAVQASLGKADTAIQTETDPTVPSWAKQSSKPSYTASEVGAVPTTRTVNGKALSSDVTLSASDVGALPDDTPIPVVPTNVSAFNNDAGYLTSHQDISGKEDKVDIVSASGATLTAEVGKYYTLSSVGTLAITLPTIAAGTTKVKTVTFYIAAGTTPAVTFTSTHSIYYSDGFEIAASSTYEVSAAYNGIAWVVASVKIVIPT